MGNATHAAGMIELFWQILCDLQARPRRLKHLEADALDGLRQWGRRYVEFRDGPAEEPASYLDDSFARGVAA